ncbi:MAG: DNA-binding MarR family transcriptional regulator [Lentisphaeria bacterium]|jgi:DNA-binding MarR family transcriptional regulator
MAVLGEAPDLSAAQVAARTAMDKVAVSRAVSKLLSAKLLWRHFDPNDKRRSVLDLPDKGKEVYRQIIPIARAYESRILEQLNGDERNLLSTLLRRLDNIQLD